MTIPSSDFSFIYYFCIYQPIETVIAAGEAVTFYPLMPESHFLPIIISEEGQLYEILSATSFCF